MARALRYLASGATYHVTSRGTGPCIIFRDDGDRHTFLATLRDVERRFSWRLPAFCLMDTHYHLVVKTPLANLSDGMKRLNGLYAVSFNRRHERVGALFQGRFHSTVIETERQLAETLRYVAFNPVRAGMCVSPDEWSWASYPAELLA